MERRCVHCGRKWGARACLAGSCAAVAELFPPEIINEKSLTNRRKAIAREEAMRRDA
jgi:hypothetical protein